SNDNVLVFTSRRDKFGESNTPLLDGQFYENIYFSRFADGDWKQPVEIGYANIFGQSIKNIEGHNAAVYYRSTKPCCSFTSKMPFSIVCAPAIGGQRLKK